MKGVTAGLFGSVCLLMAQQQPAFSQHPARPASSSGQPETSYPRSTDEHDNVTVRLPSRPKSIPFVLEDNLIRIEASINGHRNGAVLDSGSGPVVLDRTLTEGLRLREGAKGVDAGGGGKEAQQLLPVVLDDVRVGPLRFRKLDAYSGNLSHLSASAGFPVHLLVGGPAFVHGAVTIDYPKRRVTFGPTGSAGKCPAPIPVEFVAGTPVVRADIRPTPRSAPITLRLMVDLGTRHAAAMIGGAFLRSDAGQALERTGIEQQVGTGIGGKVQGRVAHVADISIAGSRFGGADVSLTRDSPTFEMGMIDGTLGVPFWQNGTITFDYPARALCITNPSRGQKEL